MRGDIKPYKYRDILTMLVLAMLALLVHTRWLARIPLTEDEETSVDIATGMGFRYENPKYAHVILPLAKERFTSGDYWQHNHIPAVTKYTIADNGNNYGYNLLLHYWINIIGFSVFRIRLLSAIFVVLTTLLLYHAAQKITGSYSAGFLAAVLFLLHPVVIIYAHIARSYAMSMLLVTMSIWLVHRLTTADDMPERRRRWLYTGFVALSVVMVLSHYFNTVIVAYNIAALFFLLKKKGRSKPVVFSAVAILVPVLAWLLVSGTGLGLVQKFQSHVNAQAGGLTWLPQAKPFPAFMGMLAMLASAFGNATPADMGAKMWVNILLLSLPVLLAVIAFRNADAGQRRFIGYLAGAILSFLAFALFVIIISGHLFICQFRFWVFIIPYAVLLPAFALRKELFARKKARLLLIPVGLMLLRAVFTGFTFITDITVSASGGKLVMDRLGPGYKGEPYEKAALAIKEKYRQGNIVVYNNWRVAQSINWFLCGYTQVQQRTDTGTTHRVAILSANGTAIWGFDSLQVHENIDGAN